MSTKHPPPLVIAVEPKKPDKHLNNKRAAILGETAQQMLKTMKSATV